MNGVTAWPGLILKDGDRLEYVKTAFGRVVLTGSNTVHRHEPPITAGSILVLHIDREREFIVISKPGSMVCREERIGGHEAYLVAGPCHRTILQTYGPGGNGVGLRSQVLWYVNI